MQKHLKILRPPFPNLLKHVSSASTESNAPNHSAKGGYYKLICRYSHLEVFKTCSENFIKLTGKHVIQSLLFNEVSGCMSAKWEFAVGIFPCILQNFSETFFHEQFSTYERPHPNKALITAAFEVTNVCFSRTEKNLSTK